MRLACELAPPTLSPTHRREPTSVDLVRALSLHGAEELPWSYE